MVKPKQLKIKCDVGIVGSGPVGLMLSGFLRRAGVQHALVDRRKLPVMHPQAHFLNARSMEIVQSFFPREYGAVVDLLPNSKYWRDFSYCHTLTGTELHRVNQFNRTDDLFWKSSPSNVAHLAQNKFETILRAEADQVASEEGATLKYFKGYHVKRCSFSPDCAIVHGESVDEASSHQAVEVECKYLIGADGANSVVRNCLGITMQGEESLQHLVNVHFSCPGLRDLLQPRPAMLYFTFHESLVAVFVAHDALSDEWVCQIPYFPPFQDRKDFTEDVVRKLITAAIGTSPKGKWSSLPLTIMSINSWVMHAQVADKYGNTGSCTGTQSHNNVFLVGDAAHRFPPSGGFGMNTGIQDAHNLAWKLALVLKGKADPKILSETYEAERRPAAQAITALSLYNYGLSAGVAAALGVDPALANTTVTAANSVPLIPFAVRRAGVLKALDAGTSSLRWMKDWERNLLGGVRVRAMRNLVDNGKSLPLIFPEVDLEYKYAQGGFVSQTPTTTSTHGASFTGLRLAVGARLPHFWLSPASETQSDSLTVSSIQLPALMENLDAATTTRAQITEACSSTPSLLFLVDSEYAAAALIAVKGLSPSLHSLFKVVSVTSSPSSAGSRACAKHDDLQKKFQIPHFVVDEESNDLELKNDQGFIERFAPVFAGNVLTEWTERNSTKHAFQFQCTTGRWTEMIRDYLRAQRGRRSIGDVLDDADCTKKKSVAIVVRPDGHVAHIVLAEVNGSSSDLAEIYEKELLRVVHVLHLI